MTTTILIVDDEWMNREMMEAMLNAYEYATLSVSNGEAAIKTASEKQPDLILMDIRMPDLDGYETTRRIKANATTQHIPVVLISGLNAAATERKLATDAGAVEVLQRGLSIDDLLARLRHHLPDD